MAEKKIKRLKESAKIEFVEKKSLFIGFSTIVKNEEEALSIIKSKKKIVRNKCRIYKNYNR